MDMSEWCPKLFIQQGKPIEMTAIELEKENKYVSRIYMDPIWDYHSKKMTMLHNKYPDQEFEIMDERENSIHKARRIHNLFIGNTDKKYESKKTDYCLYIEGGIKFTQFTVIDNKGETVRAIRLPIDYSPDKTQFFQEVSDTLYDELHTHIQHVVAYGTLYHFAKDNVPTYVNSIHKFGFENYGFDYLEMGVVSTNFTTIKMIIIDEHCLIRKSTEYFNSGYYESDIDCDLEFEIDLTNVDIVIYKKHKEYRYPYPIKYYPYPYDWLYDDEGLYKIMEIISHYS